ncbi:WYL domain-containing protein [Cytophagaceae bacterium YF14B1]|uniref:WYL domain-containing protein n=1 Tax=Xanthocytophaga flava TaxID=3048013 RepID=A0AAE3QY76_9BACT|nr:WYL domain-containing protein [Xanthocytophaga flavus]MDJ1485735.1 WYL domain-containing protein [Xanthocytophaga flavus]
MKKSIILRRQLRLIHMVEKPYTYPSQKTIEDRLREYGIDAAAERTLEWDRKHLREEYGIHIRYNTKRKGYYLDIPPDEDVSEFPKFVNLLERRERLEFLSESIGGKHSASRYLQLEGNSQFSGLELLSDLWNAMLASRVIQFTYRPYTSDETKDRIVEPGLLFEYRNRWYLAAYCHTAQSLRTFGLDRMSKLMVTDQTFTTNRADQCRNYRNHVIGVTTPSDEEEKEVLLRFTANEGKYVKSLPMHSSQQIVEDTPTHLIIKLIVTPNHELEREILAYGEEVEVLAPDTLREKVKSRLQKAIAKYAVMVINEKI